MRKILGIDIGATNLRVYIERGKHTFSKREKADFSDPPSSIIRKISVMVGDEERFDAVGIAIAGFVSSKRGLILKMPNAGVGKIRISELIKKEFKTDKVWLMNDAVAAVYGEWQFPGRKGKDIVYLTFSTGIGGAAILDGNIVAGKEGNSHEVGHIVIDADGRVECGCGARGHWEAYCSGKGLLSYFKYFTNREETSAENIFALASSGDNTYVKFVENAIRMNSAGIASVINIYAPEMLVIGGSVALNNWENYIFPSVKEARNKITLSMAKVERSALGDYASAYGAAKLAASSL